MRHIIYSIPPLLFAIICLAATAGWSQIANELRAPGVDVIAHRGASAYAPENTLSAFGLAIDQGADWFELDCTLSADGEVVVIHDDTVDRTTNGSGAVIELTFEQLRELDAGSWKDPKYAGERIPVLDESLNLGRERAGVYVEIKDSDDDRMLRDMLLEMFDTGRPLTAEERVAMVHEIEASGTRNYTLTRKTIQTIRDRGLQNDVVIQSFSPVVCAIALSEAPDIRTEFLGEDDGAQPEHWDSVIQWLRILDPPGFNPNKRAMLTQRDVIADIMNQGKTISVWTIDGRRDTIEFAHWGASAIITNRPDNALQILQEEGLR